MSDRPVPDEYTQTRAEFGRRAIDTAKAVQSILGGLIRGYEVLNYVSPPGRGTTPGQGGSTTSTSVSDSHNPYFLHDAIKALDVLIEVTEERYL